ncbi:MAG: zinc ribbon domain-containing protein [Gammaproteobacteria bacterium]|nr:zinc ribbon domain-containing protein [Gammaproteobacteria bacterium]
MPIYEYRCDACGHELDALQKINDAQLVDCPECEASALRRLISKPSFRLKGAGWYETDFKSDKEKKRNLAGTKDDKPKSGDDKPAEKDGGKSSDGGSKKTEGKKDSGTAAA